MKTESEKETEADQAQWLNGWVKLTSLYFVKKFTEDIEKICFYWMPALINTLFILQNINIWDNFI